MFVIALLFGLTGFGIWAVFFSPGFSYMLAVTATPTADIVMIAGGIGMGILFMLVFLSACRQFGYTK